MFSIQGFTMVLASPVSIYKRQFKLVDALFSTHSLSAQNGIPWIFVSMLAVNIVTFLCRIKPSILEGEIVIAESFQGLLIVAQVQMIEEWIVLFYKVLLLRLHRYPKIIIINYLDLLTSIMALSLIFLIFNIMWFWNVSIILLIIFLIILLSWLLLYAFLIHREL